MSKRCSKDDRRPVTLRRAEVCGGCGRVLHTGGQAEYSYVLDLVQCPQCARRMHRHEAANRIAAILYCGEV